MPKNPLITNKTNSELKVRPRNDTFYIFICQYLKKVKGNRFFLYNANLI